MVLGSTTTAAEHGGSPPGVHTYTLHGQHLFMNGPTIAHPPTATADGGLGGGHWESPKAKEGIKKNKTVGEAKKMTTNLKLQICFMVCFSFLQPDGTDSIQDTTLHLDSGH